MKERIKTIRKSLGKNQTEFGIPLGLRQSTITAYETGLRQPSNAVIASICREYNINETWLRTGEGEMYVVHTVEDALGDLFDAVTADEPDAFRKRVFLGLANLSPEDWETVERILNTMMGKKEEPGQ